MALTLLAVRIFLLAARVDTLPNASSLSAAIGIASSEMAFFWLSMGRSVCAALVPERARSGWEADDKRGIRDSGSIDFEVEALKSVLGCTGSMISAEGRRAGNMGTEGGDLRPLGSRGVSGMVGDPSPGSMSTSTRAPLLPIVMNLRGLAGAFLVCDLPFSSSWAMARLRLCPLGRRIGESSSTRRRRAAAEVTPHAGVGLSSMGDEADVCESCRIMCTSRLWALGPLAPAER